MTQRQRLRVVAEMLFYLNTIKRIMLILFFYLRQREHAGNQ